MKHTIYHFFPRCWGNSLHIIFMKIESFIFRLQTAVVPLSGTFLTLTPLLQLHWPLGFPGSQHPPCWRMYSYTEWWAISPSLAGSSWVISSHLNFLWSSRRLGLLAFLLPAHHFASFLDFATKLWFMFSLSVIGTDNNRCSLYVYWVVNIQNR